MFLRDSLEISAGHIEAMAIEEAGRGWEYPAAALPVMVLMLVWLPAGVRALNVAVTALAAGVALVVLGGSVSLAPQPAQIHEVVDRWRRSCPVARPKWWPKRANSCAPSTRCRARP